jgi:type IX secretion system PorP/SprF family membrane protein
MRIYFFRFLLLSLGFLFSMHTFAQVDNTPYLMNWYLINPALTGANRQIDMRVGYRRQWSGLANAPTSFYASGYSPISLLGKADSVSASRWQGVGFQISNDQSGIINKTGVFGSYAVHLTLAEDANGFPIYASFGANLGLVSVSLNQQKAILLDENDKVMQGNNTQILPDASLGLMLHNQHYFAGFSILQIAQSSYTLDQTGKQIRQFFLMAGAHFYPHEHLRMTFASSYNINFIRRSLDFQVNTHYKEFLNIGLFSRSDASFGLMLGSRIKKQINFQYAYELSLGKIQSYNNGSHQLMIVFRLKNKIDSPKYFN